jgi:hypothetical protein
MHYEQLCVMTLCIMSTSTVTAHFAFHLVDLPKAKQALCDNTPGFIWVSIVTNHLGGDHEGGNTDTITRGAAS